MNEFLSRTQLFKAAAAASFSLMVATSAHAEEWSVYGKNIPDLELAYSTGATTPQSVVDQYLFRIKWLDDTAKGINAVGQINPDLTSQITLAASRIAAGKTTADYPLLGVPVLIKDSYDVKGMITTNGVSVLNGSGTPGSTTLIAPNDAFSVAQLRAAGAIIMGKTNMSTMAYSFDGIDNAHGVVKNPYNPLRQPGGSSSGSGASAASDFAMLTMGGETGGSIRIPSNANSIVGLKTSLGLIDPGGTWPLTPTRDVVGPLGKTVSDIAYAMNALVHPSPTNLFNNTPEYPSSGPQPGTVRPVDYTAALSSTALVGKVIAVPKDMVSLTSGGVAYDGSISPLVLAKFNNVVATLKAQGATVVYVNIPATTTYYTTLGKGTPTTAGFPYAYPTTTVGGTTPSSTWSSWAAAYYYEKEIESYNDPVIKNLRDFANALLAGRNGVSGSSFSTLNSAYTNINSLAAIWEANNAKGFGDDNNDGLPDNPDAIKALQAFTSLRIDQFEGFMANPSLVDDPTTLDVNEAAITTIDAFVAPTYGSVMPYVTPALRPAGTPADPYSGSTASLMGRFESNILGTPSLSVPMGYFPDGTPMGVQFFAQLGSESKLLGFGYDYEQASQVRVAPDLSFIPEPSSVAFVSVFGIALARRPRKSV